MAGMPEGVVTFLLTEVVGSTGMWESDQDKMAAATAAVDEIVSAAVENHGGVLVKPRGEGDSHFIVFGSPLPAVRCALAIAPTLQLPVRMAIHAGAVELRDGDYYGPPVNRCARLRATAHAGQIVLSSVAADAVRRALPDGASLRSLGLHFLKDLSLPEHVFQLCHPTLRDDFPPLASLAAPGHRLPLPLNSFVARDELVAHVTAALSSVGVVQLCGVPGVGKSRLLLETAARWLVDHPGVTVESSSFGDDAVLLRAPGLLLLDDIDRIGGPAIAAIDDARRADPSVNIGVTCRRRLGLDGAAEIEVPPLDVDNAATLFNHRATAVQPDFTADPNALADICRAVDGLPLAVEMAAGRTTTLSVAQLLERLAEPLRLLGGGRRGAAHHRSMRDAIAWTVEALAPDELAVLKNAQEGNLEALASAAALGFAYRYGGAHRMPKLVSAYLRD